MGQGFKPINAFPKHHERSGPSQDYFKNIDGYPRQTDRRKEEKGSYPYVAEKTFVGLGNILAARQEKRENDDYRRWPQIPCPFAKIGNRAKEIACFMYVFIDGFHVGGHGDVCAEYQQRLKKKKPQEPFDPRPRLRRIEAKSPAE